jgi:hypothetical protein
LRVHPADVVKHSADVPDVHTCYGVSQSDFNRYVRTPYVTPAECHPSRVRQYQLKMCNSAYNTYDTRQAARPSLLPGCLIVSKVYTGRMRIVTHGGCPTSSRLVASVIHGAMCRLRMTTLLRNRLNASDYLVADSSVWRIKANGEAGADVNI